MQIKEINSHKFKPITDTQKIEAKQKLEKLRKEGAKMIKGMFEFLDAQGGWLDFSYRFYPGEPIRTVRINHGETVDLPMDLVKHLNNIWKKVRMPNGNYNLELDEMGKPKAPLTVQKISRCRFTPMDVM